MSAAKEEAASKESTTVASLEVISGISAYGCLVSHPKELSLFHPVGNNVRCIHKGDFKDVTLLQGHDAAVNCLDVSPDGALLASAQVGLKPDVILWDLEQLKVKYRLSEHDGQLAALSFSHDGRLLASVGSSKDNKLFIWDTATGHYVCCSSLKGKHYEAAAWRPKVDGKYVLVTVGQSGVNVWVTDPYKGTLAVQDCTLGHVKRHLTCVTFNETSDLFFVGSTSGDVLSFFYKTRTLKDLHDVCKGYITALCKCDGNEILVGSEDHCTYRFNASTFTSLPLIEVESGVTSICKSADGTTVIGTRNSTIWGVSPELAVSKLEENHSSSVQAVRTHPLLKGWISCDVEGNVCVWSEDCRMTAKLCMRKHVGATAMEIISGDSVLIGWGDGYISLFSIENGELSQQWVITHAHDAGISYLAARGGIFASGSSSGEVKVWDLKSRKCISQRMEHIAAVSGIQILQDGFIIVSCSKDSSVKYHNLESGVSGTFCYLDASRLNGFCMSPDEMFVVTVGSDSYLTVWDLTETETIISVEAHMGEASCLALSPDGTYVVTGGADKIIRMWDLDTGTLLGNLAGHGSEIQCVQFLSSHKMVSADKSGAVILWDVTL